MFSKICDNKQDKILSDGLSRLFTVLFFNIVENFFVYSYL